MWRGGNVERVVVEFAPEAAGEIAERTWHATQQLEKLLDGGLRLTLEVSGTLEVERWLLGYGEMAKVIAPSALAARMAARLRVAAARYGELPVEGRRRATRGKAGARS